MSNSKVVIESLVNALAKATTANVALAQALAETASPDPVILPSPPFDGDHRPLIDNAIAEANEARKDKERMDWLAANRVCISYSASGPVYVGPASAGWLVDGGQERISDLRQAIDLAMERHKQQNAAK